MPRQATARKSRGVLVEPDVLESVERLTKDLIIASRTLSEREVQYLVTLYYQAQEVRKASGNQIRELEDTGQPHELLLFIFKQMNTVETQIKRTLDAYTDEHPVAKWAKSIIGIGPVISAGLLSTIDMDKAPTMGHVWSFAGLIPGVKWKKGEKRPWNAEFKTLVAYKLGECIVKVSGNPDSTYGRMYKERKEKEIAWNERGDNKEDAAQALREKNYRTTTEAYKAYVQGKLPPAHVHARARRWIAKMVVGHFWHQLYRHKYGKEPPKPYILVNPDADPTGAPHTHYIMPEDMR